MLDIKLKFRPGHTKQRRWMARTRLTKLCWNTTYACNLACPICFSDSRDAVHDELTTLEAFEMLRRVREAGISDIIVSGGEPFVRPDMVEVLEEMARLGIAARVATNGTLLTEELVERLRTRTLVKSFQVSLDTLDPRIYAAIHGGQAEDMDRALQAARRIKAHGFHTTISTRVTGRTLAGIPELIDVAHAEGWETLTLHLPVHAGRTHGAWLPGSDVVTKLEPVLAHFVTKDPWLIETYIPWAPYHPVMKRLEKTLRVVHCGCRAGRDRVSITPRGDITPCVCWDHPEAYLGNVRTDRLLDVFENSPVCLMMREPAQHALCSGCPQLPECGGGCRTAAFGATGDLRGQDPSCPVRGARPGRRRDDVRA